MQIRPLTIADSGELYRLWLGGCGMRWPISEATFCSALGIGRGDGRSVTLGLWQGGALSAVLVAEVLGAADAALVFLGVDAARQRQGIGTILLSELTQILKRRGVRVLSLGAGALKPLWHGVPTSLPAACHFFQQFGFVFDETSYDLIQNITGFQVPSDIFRCRDSYSIDFGVLSHSATAKILSFEQRCFPDWSRYIESAIAQGRHSNVLIASKDNEIIGSVLLSVAPECPGGHWREFLGPSLGAFGILGVDPQHREQGVGLALAAYATQTLRDRGVHSCFLHWTWLREWYGRLGFRVWEEYKMGRLAL